MPSIPRSATPIRSAAELSVWWAEVLSETEHPERMLSVMWLDGHGRMLARVLSLDGIPPLPHPTVLQAVQQIHATFVADSGEADCHLAFALSRPGEAGPCDDDQAWADALRAGVGAFPSSTWSLHVAADGWITPLVDPPAERFDPRRVVRQSLGAC